MYDVSGIQKYIFSSNKLIENVGSSMLVEKVLKKFLIEAIKESVSNIDNFKEDWMTYNKFHAKYNPEIEAETIYIGGGNALVCYKNKEIYEEVSSRLAQKVFMETYSLRVTSAYIETNFESFSCDREKLIGELDRIKQSEYNNLPLQGISITKQDNNTGQPISNCYDNKSKRYISVETYLKNKGFELYASEYDEYIKSKDTAYVKNIDDIVDKNVDSYIGLVHIDGNNMGKKIKDAIESKVDYEEAIKIIRNISKEIDEIYGNVFEETVYLYVKYTENINSKDKNSSSKKGEDNKFILPIRPIVLNGDDITFICKGNLAIDTVVRFLKMIDNSRISSIYDDKISACAGIALVRSHFPFYRAYEIAEQCCSNAKKKAKLIAAEEGQDVGSWFDFHIVYNNEINTSLANIRKARYNAHYMGEAKNYDDLEEYNLLYRPWCVSENYYGKYKWNQSIKLYENLEKQKWTSSNLEELKQNYILGGKEIKDFLGKMKSREKTLDEDILNSDTPGFDEDRMTPYIDLIEIMSLYENLDEGDGVK